MPPTEAVLQATHAERWSLGGVLREVVAYADTYMQRTGIMRV